MRCRAVCGDGEGREVDGVIATIEFIIVVALVHPISRTFFIQKETGQR